MLEECSDFKETFELTRVEGLTELNKCQTEYLRELNIPSDVWNGMSKESKFQQLDNIMERFDEIEIPQNLNKETILSELYSPEIIETYKQIEAPQDYIQIEKISDVLSDCRELKYENWQRLELVDKVSILNCLEEKIAKIEHRPSCPIRATNMPSHMFGAFNLSSKTIDINTCFIEQSGHDFKMYMEVLDTLVHEGRHAYQDYNVNICEIHPRHSEVLSWAETMEGGKWGYYGDTSTLLGQRLYEQQSIEIDARNFAADVLGKFELKQIL